MALLLGLVPQNLLFGAQQVDTGVVLLFVPLCALLLAIMVETVRATLNNGIAKAPSPARQRAFGLEAGPGRGLNDTACCVSFIFPLVTIS